MVSEEDCILVFEVPKEFIAKMDQMMELSFSRNDLIQVGTQTRKTMKLLPASKGKSQKVVVADQSGVISCFSVKKGEVVVIFF